MAAFTPPAYPGPERRQARVLRGLTDEELHALNDIAPAVPLFAERLAHPLSTLSALAHAELADRELEAATATPDATAS